MTKVLIVEDDALLRKAYKTKLTLEGFEVAEAADGVMGIEQVKTWKPDVVLLDILMPNVDGIEVLRRLEPKKNYPGMRIIVFSNWSIPEKVEQALALGAEKYLVKSTISPNDMIQTLREKPKSSEPQEKEGA